MPRSAYRPKGTRVSVHIDPDIGPRLARSPRVAAEMVKVGAEIAALADATVPRDSGTLAGSRLTDVTITPAGAQLLIGYTAFYAHIVHNGSVKMPANPWLLNAALSVLVTGRAAKLAA